MPAPDIVLLRGVGHVLPDGRALFSDVDEAFRAERVGLVGPNGAGKSVLARIVAGRMAPTRGERHAHGIVAFVGQDVAGMRSTTLAAPAGLADDLAAARRLAAGDGTADDVARVGDRWDLDARWHALLEVAGLDESADPAGLSGGERVWLALVGALLGEADLLVLDEPTNHLDATRRRRLEDELDAACAQGRGVLVVSHDRRLLAGMDRTLELHDGAVRRHGGGWAFVEAARAAERAARLAALASARVERERTHAAMRIETERAARKSARARQERGSGSQSKLLLNARREWAERTDGDRGRRHAGQRASRDAAVREAFEAASAFLAPPRLPCLHAAIPAGRVSLVLEDVVLPYGDRRPIRWVARGPFRLAVRGRNGCGKSTMLGIIAGSVAPAGGVRSSPLAFACVDQLGRDLPSHVQATAFLESASTALPRGMLGTYLVQAGLHEEIASRRIGTLSGGERLRLALLAAALRTPAPDVLVLDEPTNHLDVDAVEALEAMLDAWPGGLVVASHDAEFLARLRVDALLDFDEDAPVALVPGAPTSAP